MKEKREDVIACIVKAIVASVSSVDASEVSDNADFIKDLYLDSLDMVELWMKIEKRFSVHVSEEAAVKVKKVGDLIALLVQDRGVSQNMIALRVISTVAKVLKLDKGEIHLQSRLDEDLHLDNLDYTLLLSRLEFLFDCAIPETEAKSFATVENIVDFLIDNSTVQEFDVVFL